MAKLIPTPLKTVLLVSDQDDSRILLKWFLSTSGYVVESVRNAQEAISIFDPAVHDMIVTENAMLGMSGVQMAHIIKLRSPNTPVVTYDCPLPSNCVCPNLVMERSALMLALKMGMDKAFAAL